ncbi:uncharacterized protein DUF202 [Frigoribacterium sp. PhB160]|uniref:DUF202 domain-containing protein n=1 Tax=Frigoribacterium sp. PhB160 TaxID=2485192 RepID=UPI000F47901A|nr:DUF202 domain-containing protein [Frigoribacterium sp. PhB160]ROS59129.1 uncharacterized protein DUF202 [Frigoribacterium sp. PhB160]
MTAPGPRAGRADDGDSAGGAGRLDPSTHPFDEGLQPERTALAWRRTALALTAASLVAFRVLPELLGGGAWVLAAVGLTASVGVLVAAHRRYRRLHRLLTSPASPSRSSSPSPSPSGTDTVAPGAAGAGGGLPAGVALLTLAAGVVALVVVLASAAAPR